MDRAEAKLNRRGSRPRSRPATRSGGWLMAQLKEGPTKGAAVSIAYKVSVVRALELSSMPGPVATRL